jgi:hypothetical protein
MSASTARSVPHAPPRLPIKTAKVTGRRVLHFASLGDILADAEMLYSTRPLHALGNWELGRAIEQLARSIEMALDGAPFKAAWYIRLFGPLLTKHLLSRPMQAGFQLPTYAARALIPEDECEMHAALDICALRDPLVGHHASSPSPVIGRLTIEEWDLPG